MTSKVINVIDAFQYKEVSLMLSYNEYAPVFKALADSSRLQIIDMLSCGEMCACKLLAKLNITQPTLSYHMKLLMELGLVHGIRDGAWMRYSLNEERIDDLKLFMEKITSNKSQCV
jgi:ArsR family transcriptional regulator